jgi:DNA-binding NtrC family response regulator
MPLCGVKLTTCHIAQQREEWNPIGGRAADVRVRQRVALESKALKAVERWTIDDVLIGQHPTIVKLRALVERVAPVDVTVLITGESGTGKEVVANAIHAMSPRRDRAFVPVNCAAIPHDLLESEMFGHERGAFTGASGPRNGLLVTADGGTFFLDEIGEMPLGLQAKLLRVLEDGVVRPVGSDHWAHVNVRVIAASNSDLAMAVKKHAFREDLFYRLQVVPIVIPPLRERRSDVPLLVEHFLARTRARGNGASALTISREAMVNLWSYDWPGNVRELENLIERMAILCEGNEITPELLPPSLHSTSRPALPEIPASLGAHGVNLNALVRDLEGRLINEALKQTDGNKQAAAKLLGLKRTTFSAKLRRCGVIASAASDGKED